MVHECSAPALTAELREELILEHMPQVKIIARRIHERLPVSVNLDDLVSVSVIVHSGLAQEQAFWA